MKRQLAALAILAAMTAAPAMGQTPGPIAPSIADPTRPASDTKLDASRHPGEMLGFARVKLGDTVMDVWPDAGYWTRLFSDVVGPKGKVYAYVPAEIAGFKPDPVALAKAVAAEPGRGNVTEVSDALAEQPPAAFQNLFDEIWTYTNYHDLHDSFMKGADVAAFNTAVFKLLKPGGYYIVVDHAAAAGSGLKNTENLHRIDPAEVLAEVEKAGFVLDATSAVLANPADPRTALVFDPAIRGKTDRFAFRFRKPKSAN
jgi:predicted methyltransferase